MPKVARTQSEAAKRVEQLRPVFAELAGLSHRRVATELNVRKVPAPLGGKWHVTTVVRVRERLGGGHFAPR